MFANLANLLRYRSLISSLVARELKARYRGSVFGFLWSFINPLLLLLIYTFVFTTVIPNEEPRTRPYALFMFSGILPWNWFATSLSDAAGSLLAGGNLIKKVLFPAEVLPIVSVLANMIHFFFGLTILAVFLIFYRHYPSLSDLAWFPVAVEKRQAERVCKARSESASCNVFRDGHRHDRRFGAEYRRH